MDLNVLKITLMDFGFPPEIMTLIMNCTISTSLSTKWNAKKLENFAPKIVLRQGDPMSLFLCVLCMEKLSLLLHKVQENV